MNIIPHPDFDLFGIPPTQLTVEKDIYSEHRPKSIISYNTQLQFEIHTGIDEYVQLRESLFYLKFKVNIKKKGNGNVTDADWKKIAPVSYLLHSMFRQVDVEIDGKQITTSPQTYAYKSRFEHDLGFTADAKKSHLTAAGAYNDTNEKKDFPEERSKILKPESVATDGSGKFIELMGKLHLDLAFQPRAIVGGVKLIITLIPQDPKFYLLLKDDTIVPKVIFENASLFLHRSKVSIPVVEAHNLALTKTTAKYPMSRSLVKAFNVNSGSNDITIDNAISGQLPRRVFLAMVSNDAFNGNFIKNPFRFQHFNLNYLAFYIDGTQYPQTAMKPDFVNNLFVREYLSLFEASNQINTDSTIDWSLNEWANGNTIFGCNFAPDLSDDCNRMGYVNSIRKGSMRIDLKFSTSLTETITVLLYSEFDNLLEINNERTVITDYI